MRAYKDTIFDLSSEGKRGYYFTELDVEKKDEKELLGDFLSEEELDFPEVSELDVVRHFTNLSTMNYSVDSVFYPLGSCTMKYNPKINEEVANLGGFLNTHPLQPEETVQGNLELMYETGQMLMEVAGMDAITLTPAAGAHGELTGVMMIKNYHDFHGNTQRREIIVPDSSHGTNPATAAMAGYEIVVVPSDERGLVDVQALKEHVGDKTAGLMLTNPNTLGLFEKDILEIADIVHEAGGLLYYDGANMNAIMGHVRPGDMGFDIVHYNVHKTFSTPHGGGGPGAGPVACKEFMKQYLPAPIVVKDETYSLDYGEEHSIGRMKDFQGHFGIMVRTYAYLKSLGCDGIPEASAIAVLNANYLMHHLKDDYNLTTEEICKHEFVLGGLKEPNGVKTLDVAKGLLDRGFHAPTVYFPLIVHEALMIEPTETESKLTLDRFIEAMKDIAQQAKDHPEILEEAPVTTPIRRPDETLAARKPVLIYEEDQ